MSHIIRLLTCHEYNFWKPFWEEYQEFYQVSLPEPVTEQTWLRLVDPAEPMHALGAFRGNTLVGITHYLFHRSTWAIEDTCYLQDLYVHSTQRGQGIGLALVKAVYHAADAGGGGQVYWLTHHSNGPARRLYDQVAKTPGFILYERLTELTL